LIISTLLSLYWREIKKSNSVIRYDNNFLFGTAVVFSRQVSTIHLEFRKYSSYEVMESSMKKFIFTFLLIFSFQTYGNEWKPFMKGFEIDKNSINVEGGVVNVWLRHKLMNSYEHITVDCNKKENRLINFYIVDGIPEFHQQKNMDNIFLIRPNTLGEKIYDDYCKK
jgi:hypothetical protein